MTEGPAKSDSRRRRFSFYAYHEIGHFILTEHGRREAAGLPSPQFNDIINEALLEHAKRLGYKMSKDRPK